MELQTRSNDGTQWESNFPSSLLTITPRRNHITVYKSFKLRIVIWSYDYFINYDKIGTVS